MFGVIVTMLFRQEMSYRVTVINFSKKSVYLSSFGSSSVGMLWIFNFGPGYGYESNAMPVSDTVTDMKLFQIIH